LVWAIRQTSEPGPTSYTFVEHRRYLDALLDQLGVRERVTLVVHDWGSALGFDWANWHRDAVKGTPIWKRSCDPSWADFPASPADARGVSSRR
jgi:haloalkane dehalogenase